MYFPLTYSHALINLSFFRFTKSFSSYLCHSIYVRVCILSRVYAEWIQAVLALGFTYTSLGHRLAVLDREIASLLLQGLLVFRVVHYGE